METPARLGHYEIVEELGRGGMGVVYKGYESSLGRYVAIKVLAAAMAHDPVFVERFLREARAMAALNDPHIIQIYFIGQDDEQTFFVMEFIDGESLSDWIKRETRLVPGDALKILLDASRGLATAHAQGVIHRDIKPGNIMVTSRGVVKVTDFGIALASNDMSSKLTNTGALVGTPGYLSPEVCLGKPVDQRSDIFALGIVLFEMLSGRMPFIAESPLKLMLDVVEAEVPDIRELNADVDEEASRILGRMLAKNPAERYQSCEQLNADLVKHSLVANSGPLQVRAWSDTDASKATMVGTVTPLTGGSRPPRMATPPPQVGSRTQHANLAAAAAAAVAAAQANATLASATVQVPAAAPTPAAAKSSKTVPIVIAAVLLLAVAGWALRGSLPFGGDKPIAQVPVQSAPTPPVAPPVAAPISPAPVTPDAGAQGAVGNTLAANSTQAPADAATTETNPVPVPAATVAAMEAETPVRDAAMAAASQETTRRRKLAAAAAAARAARQEQAQASSSDEEDTSVSSDDEESGGTLSAAEARKRYLCRVQKRC